jgi:tRNA (uracil-5-)-methyltransferase TRM9
VQRLLQSVAPEHGRVLIYVWAIEQDELSKRSVPTTEGEGRRGQDVFVPWAYSEPNSRKDGAKSAPPRVFNRYYHMFANGELLALVHEAAGALGLVVGGRGDVNLVTGARLGLEIVQHGWERSNYYVELQRYSRSGWCCVKL